MKELIINQFQEAMTALQYSHEMMLWNLFLALIPLPLSIILWYRKTKPSWLWWIGVMILIAFLPNAPYVLTDTIHLIDIIQNSNYSVWILTLVVIPQYLLFTIIGVESYVLSLMGLELYLERSRFYSSRFYFLLTIHFLSAVGIFLGRFLRFNSWDFVTQPHSIFHSVIDYLDSKPALLIVMVTFLILTTIYALMKEINWGLWLRLKVRP